MNYGLKKSFSLLLPLLLTVWPLSAESVVSLTSPTSGLTTTVDVTSQIPYLIVKDANDKQLAKVRLGLTLSGASYSARMTFVSASDVEAITDSYTTIHGKHSSVTCAANKTDVTFNNTDEKPLIVEVRAYDDGVVFRYKLPGEEGQKMSFTNELTSYQINTTAHRWLQPFNTSYEADFPYQRSGGQTGTWGFPALFEQNGTFFLITEANIGRNYCSTHLDNTSSANQYKVSYPFDYEGYNVGSAKPSYTGTDWVSPWRVMIIGSLATVVESTLVEDVSEPCRVENTDFVQPGRAAWIYWAYNHSSKDYQICVKYVDLAVAMGWEYMLIDWEWEQMSNGGNVEDAVRYALSKGIKPLLWYHSNDEKMQNHDRRIQELAWLKRIGVAGIKVDFFESDKQHTMQYFADLLEDAAQYQIMVNFHGCTIPRGWSRTYPHLMSQEAVFGGEQYNNGGTMTTEGARINCLLTYTRNIVGPMDYTPVAFTDSQHPHTTTFAHELALSVAFESGIQHWADRPEGFYALPLMAQLHMKDVPVAWDETRFIEGYPEKSFLIARRKGEAWYVAVLNGQSEAASFDIPLTFLGEGSYTASIIADGSAARRFSFSTREVTKSEQIHVDCLSRGGCVLTFKKSADISDEQFSSLQQQVDDLLQQASQRIGNNSGGYRQDAIDLLKQALDSSRSSANTPEARYAAYQQLVAAYSEFQENGKAEGGLITVTDDMEDVTEEYLVEKRNFSRDDASTEPNTRFGLLAEPWVVTDNIINQDNGSHGGFDSFEGGRAISIEKWNGGEPAMVNDKIYQTTKAALPAGDYHLHISVTCRAGLSNGRCLLRVARGEELPDKGVTQNVLATYDMSRTDYTGEYDVCNFHLDQPETLTLGWVLNIPQSESGHAFRVTAIRIVDNSGNDVSAAYLGNYENIQRRDRSYIRFGHPTNWQVEDFSIPNGGDGTKQGIDRYPGYDCLMLGVWDDSSRASGNLANARLYRQVTLPAGHYYFCAAYNAIYNLKSAYTFAATEPLTAAETPTKALAFYHLSDTPISDDFYGISFTLEQETTLYLGWNVDLTTGPQQEFRAKAIRLFREKGDDIVDAIQRPTPDPSRQGGEKAGAMYDLSGRKVADSSFVIRHSSFPKGIYIVNGKKVLI